MTSQMPSERMQELIRQGAEAVLRAPQDWYDEVSEAVMSATDLRPLADDPELRVMASRATLAIMMHWASANLDRPGAPVPARTDGPLDAARELVRRGYTEANLDSFRLGQGVAWRRWMKIAFTLTSDTAELEELLDITNRSISDFVDESIAVTVTQVAQVRDELARGRDNERRDVVMQLLSGDVPARDSIEQRLQYRFARSHTAAIVWTDQVAPKLAELEEMTTRLADHLQARDSLRVAAGDGVVWAWFADAHQGGLRDIDQLGSRTPGVRVAIGSTGTGLEGFRVSHVDAVSTRGAMTHVGSDAGTATFDDVEAMLLLTTDLDRANRFVSRHLGELENGPASVQVAVRAYLFEQCNASRAADSLFAHRNTILRRLARADELLPRPLADNPLNVAMALDIVRWRATSDSVG